MGGAFASRTTRAAVIQSTWTGGNGTWSQAAKWSPATVPQNNATDVYDVVIDGNTISGSGVQVEAPVTVNSLTITPGDSIGLASGNTLTVAVTQSMQVDGGIGLSPGRARVGVDGAFNGSGSVGVFAGTGSLTAAGGSLTIGTGLRVRASGDFFSPHVFVGETTYPLINNGTIAAESPSTTATVSGTTVTNNGTFQVADGATLEVNTTIQQLSDLGTIVNAGGGLLRLLGTLDNTGRTFTVPSTFPLEVGGIVNGGTITATGSTRLVTTRDTSTTLDGVTLNVPVTVQGTLQIPDGQTLSASSDVLLQNSFTTLRSVSGVFTIGSGIYVHGQGNIGLGTAGAGIVNQGTIAADVSGATLTIAGSNFQNLGMIQVAPGATLAFGGTTRTDQLGTIANNGTLLLTGTLDNTNQTYTHGSPNAFALKGGRILGGTVVTQPGQDLNVASSSSGTLDGVTLNGTVKLGSVATLNLPNGISGTGAIVVPTVATTTIRASSDFMQPPLVIGPGITIRGGSFNVNSSQTVSIHGKIQADGFQVSINGSSILADGTLQTGQFGRISTRALSLGSGGHFATTLAGTSPGLLQVTGDLDLGGDDFLDLTRIGTSPGPFLITTYSGTLTGLFDHVTDGFLVNYSTAGQITVTPVPEPTGAFATMLIVFSFARRRRR